MLVRQKTYEENNAKLYMVGVPIGNYDDMSYRAVETLKNVDIIFCEDTRVTLKLLTYFNISKPLKSYHTFNENEITDILINYIEEGKNVAVVSDAGMPIISDPGYVGYLKQSKNPSMLLLYLVQVHLSVLLLEVEYLLEKYTLLAF